MGHHDETDPSGPEAATILVAEAVLDSTQGPDASTTPNLVARLGHLAADVAREFKGEALRADPLIVKFRTVTSAARAARDIERRLRRVQAQNPEYLGGAICIGIARARGGTAAAVDGAEDALRIAGRAAAGQVLLSREVRDALAGEGDIQCAWVGMLRDDAGTAPEELFELLWNAAPDAATPGGSMPETRDIGSRDRAVPPASAAPADPERLAARYEITGTLGSGGMGVVYKAKDRETGEVVALKSLRPEVAADAGTMERFKNELRLARRITHKNVCRIHDFVRSDGTAYISMEFVEGETLRTVLTRFGSMSVRKGIQIARQVCSGLAEAHAQGIVHRDLKPENVMIDRHGNVKLMDFGVARSMQSGNTTGAGTVIGTPAYMAPEQAEGRPADARSDIYSLGLILYEVFTGTAAFRGDTPIALALKQIRERPAAPRSHDDAIPEYLEQTILRCIEKSPASRFQTVSELDDALGRQTLTPWSTPGAGDDATGVSTWFGTKEAVLLGLAALGIGLLTWRIEAIYPATHLRLQADFGQARSDVRRYLRVLLPAAQPSQKARVWIDGRTGDDVQPSDPTRQHHDFAWEFRWRARTPDAMLRGYIQVDHEGRLRSFRRLDASGSDPPLAGGTDALRSRAADLARTLLAFDTSDASMKAETRYDTGGNPFAHFEWTSLRPDEIGYRSATADISAGGVRAIGTGYSHFVARSIPVHYWNDLVGAFLFAVLLLVVFLTRTVNVGAARLRRPLLITASIGAWAATALPLLEGWLPQGDWPADVILGLAYFALIFFVSAAGEDTLLSLWPPKVMTWVRPMEGRWLTPRAAISVLRGTLWGLAFVSLYVLAAIVATRQGVRLRTWFLEWPHGSAWNPAASFLIGEFAISLAIALGPMAVSMALLRRWLRAPWAVVVGCAFFTTFVYRQEVLYAEGFAPYLALSFLGFAWFASCFYDTDLLGAVVAMVVFNGVVGTSAIMKLNLDVSFPSFPLAFAALAALPIFALLSLRQPARSADSSGPSAVRA